MRAGHAAKILRPPLDHVGEDTEVPVDQKHIVLLQILGSAIFHISECARTIGRSNPDQLRKKIRLRQRARHAVVAEEQRIHRWGCPGLQFGTSTTLPRAGACARAATRSLRLTAYE